MIHIQKNCFHPTGSGSTIQNGIITKTKLNYIYFLVLKGTVSRDFRPFKKTPPGPYMNRQKRFNEIFRFRKDHYTVGSKKKINFRTFLQKYKM